MSITSRELQRRHRNRGVAMLCIGSLIMSLSGYLGWEFSELSHAGIIMLGMAGFVMSLFGASSAELNTPFVDDDAEGKNG